MSLSQAPAQSWRWKVRDRELDLREKTLVMGVLNLTPDSFSDGGQFADPTRAVAHAEQMIADGADIIDLGAETSRPGTSSSAVSDDEEWRRLQPVLEALRPRFPQTHFSVDTYRGATAERALDAGADIINDIYALRHSPEIAGHCARHNAGLLLMHMQGTPETMQDNPCYDNVLAEIRTELVTGIEAAVMAGLAEDRIAVDPGIGFGKSVDHNVEILAGLEYLRLIQRPICVGASRKGFLGKLTGDLPVTEREEATIAAHCAAALQGAGIIRTHNVKAAVRSLAVIDAIRKHAEL
jgi:dihydropteroate synthase